MLLIIIINGYVRQTLLHFLCTTRSFEEKKTRITDSTTDKHKAHISQESDRKKYVSQGSQMKRVDVTQMKRKFRRAEASDV